MGYVSDWVSGACDCCKFCRENRKGDYYCSKHEDDYFPDAEWDDDDSECPSYREDPDLKNDDDWDY